MRYETMVSMEGLLAAWEIFRIGKRMNQDVQDFERHLEDNLFTLHWELMNRTYHHASYHRFPIHDPKPRVIHKASVRDRVVHHALYRALMPLFEPSFIFDSYSCRVGKGTHAAVQRLDGFIRSASQNGTRLCWALKCDIRKFFDSINHSILFQLLQQRVFDQEILKLVEKIVGSFSVDNFNRERESSRRPYRQLDIATFCECIHGFL